MLKRITVQRNKEKKVVNVLPSFTLKETEKYRKKWHGALISGAFTQGRKYLCTKKSGVQKFCCLGVGELVISKIPVRNLINRAMPYEKRAFCKRIFSRSDAEHMYSIAEIGGVEWSAYALNDVFQLTFKQIAKLVWPEGYNSNGTRKR